MIYNLNDFAMILLQNSRLSCVKYFTLPKSDYNKKMAPSQISNLINIKKVDIVEYSVNYIVSIFPI
ncbi:hypothetical protein MACH08_17680 [Oceanobacillus kimchii]|uniref:Uncharacterized protein n=1 Tax=Oceanobacillus kimchii TaxID=746691 RepID=A0ABQ5TJY6_9BACI|nr:hypothetical protein MACH08_17680 [Oceanobacillus kimchii]